MGCMPKNWTGVVKRYMSMHGKTKSNYHSASTKDYRNQEMHKGI